MHFIYLYENKINNKKYVGQTNNIQRRHNLHKSSATNKRNHSHNLPFASAIRKYGIENFSLSILEKVDTLEQANDREAYWIKKLQTLVSQNGYNIHPGGNNCKRGKMPWDELKNISKIFSGDEIEDIQNRLIKGEKYHDIINYYSPRLTPSFLSNINNGWNYKNPNLSYPLKKDFSYENSCSKEYIDKIKEDIKKGTSYQSLQTKYGCSISMISNINNGKSYFDPNEVYPLFLKDCADKSWVQNCIYDIIFSEKTLKEIAYQYNKCESSIKKLAQGKSYHQKNLIYPLRSNREKNKILYKTIFK